MEEFVRIESGGERLVGVWTGPEGAERLGVTVITLHGWGGYRIGPHRFMVKLCRTLAREGAASLRFDFRGRGDSTGEQKSATLDTMIEDTCRAIEYAGKRAPGNAIVLWGLCSGGNVAIGAATLRPEVRDLVLLSTLPFIPQKKSSEKIARTKEQAGNYFRKLFRAATWKKLFTGAVNFGAVKKALFGHWGKKGTVPQQKRGQSPFSERDAKDSARDIMAAFEKYEGRAAFIYGGADREAADARGHYTEFTTQHGIPATFEAVEGSNHDFYSLAWERQIIEWTVDHVHGREGTLPSATGQSPSPTGVSAREASPLFRVAFIAGEYPKASETFLLRELRELRRRGLDFVVVATGKLPDAPEAAGIDAQVLLRPRYLSWRSLAAELRFCFLHPFRYLSILLALYLGHWRNLREITQAMLNVPRALAVGYELRRLGVTRIHALWANLPATLGWIIARALGMEFSFAAHSRDVFVDGRMLKEKVKLARHVVVCNRAAADRLAEIVGERLAKKIVLVHHGIERATLPTRTAEPGDFILAAGRFEAKKGFDVLIRACGILAREDKGTGCVIVGDGPLRERFEALIAREHAPVELRPWMRHDELMQLVAKAAAVVVPSVVAPSGDRDGIPNIILEAMAIGAPVVATNVGSIGDVVKDGETGRLADAGSPEALAAKIAEILAKRAETRDITRRADELIGREFALSDTVSTLEKLIRD